MSMNMTRESFENASHGNVPLKGRGKGTPFQLGKNRFKIGSKRCFIGKKGMLFSVKKNNHLVLMYSTCAGQVRR